MTPLKSPKPQMTKERTPCAVEKKFSKDMTDDAAKLIITPVTSNMTRLLMKAEKAARMAIISIAPAKEAKTVSK